MQRLDPKTSSVVVVDVQERLASAMPDETLALVLRATRILVESARLLGARVIATEQYPKGLGSTLPEVADLLDHAQARRIEKVAFSATDADGFVDALKERATRSVVLVGMESHVCVYQTARELVHLGFHVHVAADGVASRREDHRLAGLDLSVRAGAIRTTAESVVFDWLARAGTEEFKAVSRLVR